MPKINLQSPNYNGSKKLDLGGVTSQEEFFDPNFIPTAGDFFTENLSS